MLKNNSKTELLIILDAASRKVLGWKLFPCKENITSEVLIDCLQEAIRVHGAPKCIHSDADIKNHSASISEWFSQTGIQPSITKDIKGNQSPVHGNQAIEWFNGTIKHYFNVLDKAQNYLDFQFNQLQSFIDKNIQYYNNKSYKALSTDMSITPKLSLR